MTSFQVPHPVAGSVTGWAPADFLDATYLSPPAAGGAATLFLPQLEPGVLWQLSHMVCECSSVNPTQLRLYLDAVNPRALRDGTSAGNFDVADWPQGLLVPEGRQLVAQWTGADVGAVGVLTVQGVTMRKG